MRKTLSVILAVILLGLMGCESPSFKAERKMYKAHKLAEKIFRNPKSTPPKQFEEAVEAYRKIAAQYPGSVLEVQAEFSIGHLYLVRGAFEEARAQYKKLTLDCDKKGNLCAEAHFAIGNTYELEQSWPAAEAEYKFIMNTFPFSAKSLDLPLYIIRHYRREKATPQTIDTAVDQAVAYYTNLKADSEQEKGDFILQGLVSRSFMEGERWLDALDSLDKLTRDFPDFNPEQALWVKALIYANKLGDREKAKEELKKIVSDYPDSALAQKATIVIDKM